MRVLRLPLMLVALPIVGVVELVRAVHRWRERRFDEWELRQRRECLDLAAERELRAKRGDPIE